MRSKYIPYIILAILVAVIAFTNIQPGTILSGWDNLHPEFDFALNLKRSLFAVWQEYQGLGLLGGMGHAAALPRELILWILSLILPTNFLRYTWTFGMLGLGALGVYVLLKNIFLPSLTDQTKPIPYALQPTITLVALLGSIFYITNLATVQMFSVPFEAFTTHFGFLPWLCYSFISYLSRPNKKTLLLFILVNILGATQGYVPTVFIVSLMALGMISFFTLIQNHTWNTGKKLILLWTTILTLNAYWILPSTYFAATKSFINVNAKINQMATDEVYLKNQAYGTIGNTVQLKGFWFNTFDLDPTKNEVVPIINYWSIYTSKPFISLSLIVSFAIILTGVVIIVIGRHKQLYWLIGVFLFGFTMLTTNTEPFASIDELLRRLIPLFYQVFRFPYTKFSILTGMSYSVLFSLGIFSILLGFRNKDKTLKQALVICTGCILLFVQSYPLFQGKLFYDPMKRIIPQDYIDLFRYMKDTRPGRIANLPQASYWGWSYYRWGYTGSGFLWYGIEQPIQDRAFDPWSNFNENYYWELTRAMYAKDTAAFDAVLNKYDVRYILLDENLVSPSHNRALFTEEIKTMLAQIPSMKVAATFGGLTLYEKTDTETRDFISLKSNLPTVSPIYQWTDNDVAYRELGDYISSPANNSQPITINYRYPFRSLFTKRSVDEREFTVEENENTIAIRSLLFDRTGWLINPKEKMYEEQNDNQKNSIDDSGSKVKVDKIDLREVYHRLFPSRAITSNNEIHERNNNADQKVDNNKFYDIGLHNQIEFSSSQIAVTSDTPPNNALTDNTVGQSARPENTVGKITNDPTQPAERLVNNPDNTRVTDRTFRMDITSTVPGNTFRVNVTIPKAGALIYDSTKSADLIAENVKPCGVLREGTATAQNQDQFLRFTSRNHRGCLSFSVGNLPHREGYLVAVESRHISGRPLLFSLINQTAKHVELETYLSTDSRGIPRQTRDTWKTTYFILSPLASDGLGYSVYLSNDAIGKQQTVNDIKSIKFYRIPYQELITLRSAGVQPLFAKTQPQGTFVELSVNPALSVEKVDHPNPAYYKVALSGKGEAENKTLILSQSIDPGWKAYEIKNCQLSVVSCQLNNFFNTMLPFLFSTELKNHVLINNWANGWTLPNNPASPAGGELTNNELTIILFFLPQLFQWLGFALLPIPFILVLYTRKK